MPEWEEVLKKEAKREAAKAKKAIKAAKAMKAMKTKRSDKFPAPAIGDQNGGGEGQVHEGHDGHEGVDVSLAAGRAPSPRGGMGAAHATGEHRAIQQLYPQIQALETTNSTRGGASNNTYGH